MIPAGTYRAVALSGGLGYTQGGKEQVGVDFQITEGEQAGQHITWYGYFTDRTTDRTLESLRTCGWEGDDLCDLTGLNKNAVDLVVEVDESPDPRTGEIRARTQVRWINRPGGLQMKDMMDAGQAREFANRMKGKIVAMRGGGQRPAAAPAPRPAYPRFPPDPQRAQTLKQQVETDDIPF